MVLFVSVFATSPWHVTVLSTINKAVGIPVPPQSFKFHVVLMFQPEKLIEVIWRRYQYDIYAKE